jgi:hypothetical protein
MAKVAVTVHKTYEVEIEVPREEIDYHALKREAEDLVYRGDSNVVYKGISSGGLDRILYTDEETAQILNEQAEEDDRWSRVSKVIEEAGCTNVIVSLGEELEEKVIENAPFCNVRHRFVYSGGFGEGYESPIYADSNWLDVICEADDAIEESGDKHHVFLERVYEADVVDDVVVYTFSFGS